MLKIAICDDDIKFVKRFTTFLSNALKNRDLKAKITTYSGGKDLIEKIEKEYCFFDVIFLDIEMPEIDGFQVAHRLREIDQSFILIFITYMENQSRKGYFYEAFRYIFKNSLEVEIEEALDSILNKLGKKQAEEELVTLKHRVLGVLEDLTLRKSDIIYLKVEKSRRVTLRTLYAEYNLSIKSLAEYAQLLSPSIFVPIMRSYLVNFTHVEGTNTDSFLLTGGITIPLGVKKNSKKDSLAKYMKFLRERV